MEKKNFISKEQVKRLVENCKYDNYYFYIVPIPNKVDTQNAEQFKDFVKKVKEEFLRRNKLSNAKKIEDIYSEVRKAKGVQLLALISYYSYIEENRAAYSEKTVTEQVYIPNCLIDKDFTDAELNEWAKGIGEAIWKQNDCGIVRKIKIDNNIATFTVEIF